MPFRTKISKIVPALVGVLAIGGNLHGQGGFEPQGSEFSVSGVLPGDQVYSDLALGDDGGYLVWQDNQTDGDGAGISAVKLNSASTAVFDSFRVNSMVEGNQERPKVAGLIGGAHLVVWQGGSAALQNIYGRAISADGVFLSSEDFKINTHISSGKISPDVAALSQGGAVVVWSSYGQDDPSNPIPERGALQGVYGQVVSADGELVGAEIQVNESVEFSQRTPGVAGLENDQFVVVWATEGIEGSGNYQKVSGVNILGRIFSGDTGLPVGGEFQINTSTDLCANPAVTATSDGGFTVVWSQRNLEDQENSWDIASRHFASTAPDSGGAQAVLNSYTYGDQYAPKIEGKGNEQLVVWTSLGQDGSHEGVYGRFLSLEQVIGDEFLVNTHTVSLQTLPTVASLTENSLLVTWSSFVGGDGGVDLRAQRYSVSIPRPGAPIVSASSSYELFVAWPEVAGFDIEEYQLYVDGNADPVIVVDNFHRQSGLNPGTTHSFRLAYKLTDSRVSPLSDIAIGSSFGGDFNFDGLPDDWQSDQFGSDDSLWDGPLLDTDGDGVNNLNEFLAGTNAGDGGSVLKMHISQNSQGWVLNWNSVPGLVYKVQASDDFNSWGEVGGYRFSAGSSDSTFVEPTAGMEYYRVIRIR